MAADFVLSARRPPDSILTSVFPTIEYSQPTPETTPTIGVLSSPGRPFGGGSVESFASVDHDLQITRAWSTVTRYLHSTFSNQSSPKQSRPPVETRQALIFLCTSPALRKHLLTWTSNEITSHFQSFVQPQLDLWNHAIARTDALETIQRTIRVLQSAQQSYLNGPAALASSLPRTERAIGNQFVEEIKSRLHQLVTQSLPHQALQRTLAIVFYDLMVRSLNQNVNIERCYKAGECLCVVDLDDFPIDDLVKVGLGKTCGEQAFAHAVHNLLQGPAVERHCFLVDWSGRQHVIHQLQKWIEKIFTPFIRKTMATLNDTTDGIFSAHDQADLLKIAIDNLGRQRTSHLFDYVNRWPASEGAIRDLREFIALNGPAQKAQLCTSFSSQVSQRLLHSGASTSEILSIYINVIHAFRALDARGVLLEKVAAPVRTYLRSRDDTVNIIAASLLADVDASGSLSSVDSSKICVDIPKEVERSAIEGHREDSISNWNDMNWMPDPIDAGPDYKSSKSEDVVAYVLGLFEQDDFINELKNVLATTLLESKDPEFVRETRLVELLKARLDVTRLQAIEVMLKDARDSVVINRRINPASRFRREIPPTPQEVREKIPDEGITMQSLYRQFETRIKQPQFAAIVNTIAIRRQNRLYPKRTRPRPRSTSVSQTIGPIPDFQVQIISKNFWPELTSDDFKLPPVLEQAQSGFKNRFDQLGGQRKLHFRPALGQVTVELELEDRTVKEENVQTWKASVIHVFDSSSDSDTEPKTCTPAEAAEILQMDEDLATSALHFWVAKKVLYQPSKGTFAVLERLDMDTQVSEVDGNVTIVNETVSAVRSQDAMFQASAPMFCTFISHMLRNAGPKEVEGMMGITSMLKMVCPMFTHGDEEVRWLLAEMEGKGEVVKNGEVWAIVG